ncbi:MAG: ABC transporter permease [Crocinitomicaceae bacterium]|nr:MAG: ABC transporter permease [Crocinitomicaceae bacterium]
MKKLLVSLKKEILLLMSDKVGLLLMYLMPLLLVFIITLVQDSAFKLVNENRLELLIINDDKGAMGDSLINRLKLSGNFTIEIDDNLSIDRLKKETLDRKKLMSIYIPVNFSKGIQSNSAKISNLMLTEFGVVDSTSQTKNQKSLKNAHIDLFFDPILQDNFRLSIMTGINTIISGLENQDMMEQLFRDMGYDKIPDHIRKELVAKEAPINPVPAVEGEGASVPNSSQHNVPAWSLFAMFFMVISLGGNIVKERLSGSFIRLQTIPSAFLLTIWSKIIVYLFVALTQLTIMFMIGIFVFPYIELPQLELPSSIWPVITISVLSAIAAISYSLLIGVYAKTQEQANGFGAISIIIFAAIGGIWVPSFVMPEYMQQLGKISPLHWCIEGYYTLFLKNGAWSELTGSLIFLTLFIVGCQFFTYLKLRVQNYI